ncbi:glycosyl transferase family protein 2 [Thermococcus cleftensis]|uniref:Glycosyl transferase family protein 2 n=1 Tax=Thermococcus cleftensis (strain DSM 27260 / KACC 17922 / CL1) TaxID=163003 RepID=I3ZTM7_THECF|nr:glycosyltransferase family 4 protein [Thermococcus cleftensis]AFL95061.1 glycosyl transferase family protein 2 [Thermococcus cleftensis]
MKRRVLIVSPYFYPEGGGLEKYAFNMALELSEKNEVTVLCMTRGEEGWEDLGGIRVYRVKPGFIVSNTPLSLRFVLKTAGMVRRADLVIAHTPVPFAADVASFLAKLRGIPIRIVYHTVGLKKGAGFLDALAGLYSATLERLTLRGVGIIAVSKTVWEYLRENGYNPRVSHPQISLPEHASRQRSCSREKVILFVGQLGRYHRFKNLYLLVRAFSELSVEFPEWKLWVVGDGDLLDEYRRLALELGLGSRVRFFGRINNPEELAEIYSRSGVLVLPSSFESFGMVVAEALAFGVPVIVSPHVGARILVEPGKNGFVLRDLSVSSLVDALKLVMDDPKLLRKLSSRSTLRGHR